jgi:protein-S-isoprenylcysteine O-methyltransferase Ste14
VSTSNDGFIQRGGLWVVAQSVLTVAALLLAPLFRGQWDNVVTTGVGGVLFGIGGWVGIAGVRALGRNRTAYPQPLAEAELVQSGIYARVRHPLYSSLMFVSFGWALGWASGAGLAAASALTVLLHGKATREEHWLRTRYPDYRAYEQRVNRFVPWVR